MDDLKLLEAVEKYIRGEMLPDERVQFENLRKSSPEIDQLVVEHTYFLHQMNRFDETKKFKAVLNDIHIDLAEQGAIESPRLRGKAKVVYLINKYKRVASIAASIAGITALTISALMWSVTPPKPAAQIQELSREINVLKNENRKQNREIAIAKQINSNTSLPVTYNTGGTSFLIDPKGFLVTNAHIVEKAKYIAVQNSEGKDLKVELVHLDTERDIAILKIVDTAYKAPSSLPYGIRKGTPDIAEAIYTLGYPRNEIVYGEGYLAAKTGYNGDTLTCQIAIAANPGNSGGPILNKNGEIVGILSAKQISAEGVVFATQSKYIHQALSQLQKDTAYQKIKLPVTSNLKGMDRMQQVKKITDYVYMVKVN